MHKQYIGDGVYVSWDGYGITMTTENGSAFPTNIIYLEPSVFETLQEYFKKMLDFETKSATVKE